MAADRKTNSSGAVPLTQKLSQGVLLFINHISRIREAGLPRSVLQDIEEYDQISRSFIGRSLYDLRVFEIGYGARPYRLATMISLGVDASGVDLDAPMLTFRLKTFREIFKKNGLERLLKSAMRFIVADIIESRQIKIMLLERGKSLRLPREHFLVGDAADVVGAIEGSVDLFVSESVFEHIPRDRLEQVVDKVASKLSPDGIALIRPNIFTGITGGHRVEWFEGNIGKKWCAGWSLPWCHLIDSGSVGDTYLNKLSRSDYRSLFQGRFRILKEQVKYPGLGKEYLSEQIRQKLRIYDVDELFSNQVMFVLAKK